MRVTGEMMSEMKTLLDAEALSQALGLLRELAATDPAMTVGEAAAVLEGRMGNATAAVPKVEHGTCQRCGQPVVRSASIEGEGRFLTHADAAGHATNIGCRAASFQPGVGWNDAFDRSWRATWS